jgi:flagellar biosynthetic protein FlhB
MADAQDRRLPATDRKIRKSRAEGQVPRSRDLSHFVAIGAFVGLVAAAAPLLARALSTSFADALRFDARTLSDAQAMTERLAQFSMQPLWLVLLLGLVMIVLAVAGAVASGGWNFSWKAVAPKFSKLDPLAGIGRMFSQIQLVNTLKTCLLALILGTVGALYLQSNAPAFVSALGLPLMSAIAQASSTLFDGLLMLVLALALFAAVDVPLQRHQVAEQMKMSVAEFKQEQREVEGNAEIKSRQRSRMREVANRRMLAAVPTADLVVMNPTHFAVALKYEEGRMAAPKVVAKGADLLAFRIRDAAQGAKVPVLQAPPLARALYAHAEVDKEVPAALFAVVAQVLAHVYQLRAFVAGRGVPPPTLPVLEVPPGLDPITIDDDAAGDIDEGDRA